MGARAKNAWCIKQYWEYLFIVDPDNESYSLNELRYSQAQNFLYYALIELNDEDDMQGLVDGMTVPTVRKWLSAIKTHYGTANSDPDNLQNSSETEFYNQMIEALMDGNSQSRWLYSLDEHHMYGSSRLGVHRVYASLVMR